MTARPAPWPRRLGSLGRSGETKTLDRFSKPKPFDGPMRNWAMNGDAGVWEAGSRPAFSFPYTLKAPTPEANTDVVVGPCRKDVLRGSH